MFAWNKWRRGILHGIVATLLLCGNISQGDEASPVLATVNQAPITQRDLDLELLISGIRTPTPEDRQTALDRVIDRQLIADTIETKGPDTLAEDVENLVQFIRRGIESGGDTVENVLRKLKLTEADIRNAARMTVHWNAHVRRTINDRDLRAYFEKHRDQFDGTQVRIRQIVRIIPADSPPAALQEAEELLNNVRQKIEAGQLDFAEAAKTHSQSPSGKNGGEIGFIRYQGDVPGSVAQAAFSLKAGQISPVIHSNVGVHLIQTLERKPGELSLEDARPAVLRVLGDELWRETARKLRSKAKITRE